MVIGPCGAGKSTLATLLSQRTGLPVHHLDRLHWRPGWVEGSKDELRATLARITATPAWIIDGHYGGSLDDRLPHADTIIFLDYPVGLCLWRLVRRRLRYRGRSRPDMAEGCEEKLDLALLRYLVGWRRGPRARLLRRLRGHEDRLLIFRSPRRLAKWLSALSSVPSAQRSR